MTGIARWSDIAPAGTDGPVAESTRVLALLESAEEDAVTISQLRAQGVATPGQSVYELQLAGYPIDRIPTRGLAGHRSLGYRLRRRAQHQDARELSESPS